MGVVVCRCRSKRHRGTVKRHQGAAATGAAVMRPVWVSGAVDVGAARMRGGGAHRRLVHRWTGVGFESGVAFESGVRLRHQIHRIRKWVHSVRRMGNLIQIEKDETRSVMKLKITFT